MIEIKFTTDEPKPGIPVVLPIAENALPPQFADAAAAAEFTGALEETCDITSLPRRILLSGLGANPTQADYENAGAIAIAQYLALPELALDLRGLKHKHAAAFLTGATLRAWRFSQYFTQPQEDASKLTILHARTDDDSLEKSWPTHHAVLQGVLFARDLVTEPANILTPQSYITRLKPLSDAGVTLTVLSGEALRAANLSCLQAVGGGSIHPPALAILRWPGTHAAPPVAFVGKGITFDTGGICIKPADAMWEMRADMAGSAACAGALLALALRRSPAPVTAFLALAENTTGGASYRPSDILRHANGTTIEVVDTDAEGRLVLADALHAATLDKPQAIIDLATLTGSIIVALGHHMAGIFANDDALAAAVAAAGAAVGERVWRMPIDPSHRDALKSDIADLRHCSPERMQPDASQAAAFLREFVGDTPWVHIDIAGVENAEDATDRTTKGATGFGVRLLDRLIADRYEDPHRV